MGYSFANPLQVDLSSIFDSDVVASSAANGQSYPPLVSMDGEGNDYMTAAVAQSFGDTSGAAAGVNNDGLYASDTDHPNVQFAFSDTSAVPNAVILNAPNPSILTVTFPIVATSYSTLQLYGTSTEGSTDIAVTLNYSDGTTDAAGFTVPDWFDSWDAFDPVFVVQTGLSRFSSSGDDGSDTPALYGGTVTVNSAKTLTSVTVAASGSGRFVFMAATAY